ncbi:ATP-binding protein [Candidatus Saccharibacteria bacterium]|nr:ATP-binding protein [Candidatus Saccharibacteria bacterium]
MDDYRPRIADAELERKLVVGAVLIEGAKWCGKTSTAERQAKSILYMDDPDKKEQNIALAENSPTIALRGDTPRLIDEWQLVPKLWDAVRYEVDHRKADSQFILTGSAVPPITSDIHHTGSGRIARLLMRPMSLFESGESSGSVSLTDLFNSPRQISGQADLGLDELAFLACRGGWPRAINYNDERALTLAEAYYDGLVNSDIVRVDNVNRSPLTTKRIMRSYARMLGQQTPYEQIKSDVEAGEGITISVDTIYDYINALRKIYVIEDAPSWNPNLRSKAAIRTTDTRYFVDPSIATQAMKLKPADLINDLNTFGFIYENLCIRDLRIYADAIGKEVAHYRDSNGVECDAVIRSDDGKYGLIQIKLGSHNEAIEQAVNTLNSLEHIINYDKMPRPSFKMVLCGNCPYAYRREDGIYVVPIGCLKP